MQPSQKDFMRFLAGDDEILSRYTAQRDGEEAESIEAVAIPRVETDAEDLQDETMPTVEELNELEERLKKNPEEVLGDAVTDPTEDSLTPDLLRQAVDVMRRGQTEPEVYLRETADAPTEALEVFFHEAPHPDFDFNGYDPETIPINLRSRKFETGDIRYATSFARRLFAQKYEPYPRHTDDSVVSDFVYEYADGVPAEGLPVALFSDFGNGLYHASYIAKTLVEDLYPYAFHLGDVYYGGTASQFRKYYYQPLNPLLANTRLFSLLENHEMDSGAKYYFKCLRQIRDEHPGFQQQEGSYFCVRIGKHQLIGLDVNYVAQQRLDPEKQFDQKEWLKARLQEGRDNRLTTILLTGGGPYRYDRSDLTDLYKIDLFDLLTDDEPVDIWFWGHHHYCAFFDRDGDQTPFLGSCIGHGGYPYSIKKHPDHHVPKIRWMEEAPRFPEWTGHRQDRGNNGFCKLLLLPDGGLDLNYIDWMRNLRCKTELRRRPGDLFLSIVGEPETFELPGR